MNFGARLACCVCSLLAIPATGLAEGLRGTGNLGIVIERATGSVLVVDTSSAAALGRVEGVGDLSHASAVFSPRPALRLCVRTRRRADQDRSAHRVDRRARRSRPATRSAAPSPTTAS